jgi:hypothetical protein
MGPHNAYAEYRLWIIVIFGGLSVLILSSIWNYYYFKHRKAGESPDFGLIYLCAGLTVWVIASILGLCSINDYIEIDSSVIHSFSMINNGLIACSFPFFEYSVISNESKKIRDYWPAITLSITGVVIILIYIFGDGFDENVGNLLDFLSSSLVLIILTGILHKTFDKRKLKPLGYLSILVTVAMLLSQFLVSFQDASFLNFSWFLVNLGFVMGGIAFCMFVLLLIALAFTWILDGSNVFDEWRDGEIISNAIKSGPSGPTQAIDYLESLIANGISKYELETFRTFLDFLPPEIQERVEYKRLYSDFNLYCSQLSTATNTYLKGQINFDEFTPISARVTAGILEMLKDIKTMLKI